MEKLITKASGEKEVFSVKKFQRSLRKSGADEATIARLTQEIMNNPAYASTYDIYKYAFNQLRKKTPAVAARYNLKAAISELGPSGFPFEKFVAEIFKQLGYQVLVDQVAQGFCVSHELDVVIKKDNQHHMVECKFHVPHLKANIKVPLYIKARFDDLEKRNKQNPQDLAIHGAWVVTNTKFTSDAITYGECVGLKMLDWSYPEKDNLAQLIDKFGLHPITALTSISRKQKHMLIEEGVVLCKDALEQRAALRRLGINEQKIEQLVQEAEQMCELGAIA